MCGIFLAISRRRYYDPDGNLHGVLQARGPDSTNTLRRTIDLEDSGPVVYLSFMSTVLSLRGNAITEQPYEEVNNGSALCWNGEAWSVNKEDVRGNDTEQVFHLLKHDSPMTMPQALNNITTRLSRVSGPYAFVYYDHVNRCVYMGRDFLGRRSLLWSVSNDGDLLVSSVVPGARGAAWTELDADGVYCIDLRNPSPMLDGFGSFSVTKQPYIFHDQDADSVIPRLVMNKDVSTAPSLPLSQRAQSVMQLQTHLTDALRKRVLNIPLPPTEGQGCTDVTAARLAILFSGGLDCTLLARLTHDLLPTQEPIDLLNVAFQNPRIHKDTETSPYEMCPDRITGRAAFQELLEVCPDRPWRLVTIDVPFTDVMMHRESVMALMHPHNTEMDLSISYALYFASRGAGVLSTVSARDERSYMSAARVLLSGLGADELFAGYTRHATAFRRNGFEGLFEELDLDVGRLGKRNLGRDDRVISHWGKEARFPYLDEGFVHWALAAPITEKTGFGESISESDIGSDPSLLLEPGKKVLRCLAWKLGMVHLAKEKKRAIQFGTRTAKMETNKTKGTTVLT